jgi:hypothetical protein
MPFRSHKSALLCDWSVWAKQTECAIGVTLMGVCEVGIVFILYKIESLCDWVKQMECAIGVTH